MKLLYSQIILSTNKIFPVTLISGVLALHCMECECFQVIAPKVFARSFSLKGNWVMDMKVQFNRKDLSLASELYKEILLAVQLKVKLPNIFLAKRIKLDCPCNLAETVNDDRLKATSFIKRRLESITTTTSSIRRRAGALEVMSFSYGKRAQWVQRTQAEYHRILVKFYNNLTAPPTKKDLHRAGPFISLRKGSPLIFGSSLNRFLVEKAARVLGQSAEMASRTSRSMVLPHKPANQSRSDFCGDVLKPFGLYFVPELSRHSGTYALSCSSRNFGSAKNIAHFVRRTLSCRGYTEILSTSFSAIRKISHSTMLRTISIMNPLNKSSSILRGNMVSSLLTASRLISEKSVLDIRLFELGFVYRKERKIILNANELRSYNLAILSYGVIISSFWKDKSLRVDLHSLKFELVNIIKACGIEIRFEEVLHHHSAFTPNNYITLNDERIGFMSELRDSGLLGQRLVSSVSVLEVSLSSILRRLFSLPTHSLHRPPETSRDLSVVCKVPFKAWVIMNSIFLVSRKEVAKRIIAVNQFDCFQRGINRVLGFRVTLCTQQLNVQAINHLIGILVNHLMRTNKVCIQYDESSVKSERHH